MVEPQDQDQILIQISSSLILIILDHLLNYQLTIFADTDY